MKQLTLRQKIGQLMVCGFKANNPADVSDEIVELIRDYHVGGIILFGRNIGTPEDILKLNTRLQLEAKLAGHDQPLLICIDQENGVVRRLGEGTTVFPGAMLLGATGNPEFAYDMGLATGKELKALGINWNLAPVVDVNNNPNNPVIGVRSFGEHPFQVAEFGKAAMKGMQAAGIITSLKHFPGHGDTNLDSHLELPTINHSMERLEEVELLPFKDCIKEGADTVMSAHVYFPAIEKKQGVPATMSRSVITGLLREKLGFQGVVTTDCMEMKAIADTIGTAQGAVEAIKAGIDLVMISHLPSLQKDAIEAIATAVENNELSVEQIDAALDRVRQLKSRYLSWNEIVESVDHVTVPDVVGCEEHRVKAEDAFRHGITLVNNNNVLPLSTHVNHKVLVIYTNNSYLTEVEDKRYSSNALGAVIQEVHPTADIELVPNQFSEEMNKSMIEKAKQYETIIIGTLTASNSKDHIRFIKELVSLGKNIVVIAMRSPYDLSYLPKQIDVYIATYEFTTPALRMAAKAIYGLEEIKGQLPITIN
ncbi:beta-N-acetylhexosaminidase [Litchfieldia alkalitelluris]|uniref:beta-N-acetylhexosaminidase n=1 Tax=Litchfieldia alkalitelluris TaxID=304268 RepID=UPI00099798EC|nr:beta-N-acetylhexosaminidase [Litchfieldia alkalitelluris]